MLNVDMQIEFMRGFRIVFIFERILKFIVYYLVIRDVYVNLYLWIFRFIYFKDYDEDYFQVCNNKRILILGFVVGKDCVIFIFKCR